jgi:hypothetical protein
MRARTFVASLAVLVIASYLAGRALRPGRAEPVASVEPAVVATEPAAPPLAQPPIAARPPQPANPQPPPFAHRPRFAPPPIPEGDSGLAGWLKSGSREPTNEMLHGRDQDIGASLDELFGSQFPVEKREKVLAAQRTAMTASAHDTWDYFHGEISQDEFSTRLHQTMLGYAHQLESTLSADEYRRFMRLEPGADPMSALSTPGLRPGARLPEAAP